jgi:hypothetical protein
MKKAIIPAFMLVLASTVLGATVLREPLAWAAPPITSVFVTNDESTAIPAREQNLDTHENIKVHEQGTADVNVTNTVSVSPPAAIEGGGGRISASCPGMTVAPAPITASALQIERSTTAGTDVQLLLGESRIASFFSFSNDERHVVLPLTRPVRFDRVSCSGLGTVVVVNWVGNEP